MSDRVFLDSNILIYTYSNSEHAKRFIAQNLVTTSNSFISTQVLQELCNVIIRKFKFDYSTAVTAIKECSRNNYLHVNTQETVLMACAVAERYRYSFYDCLIIAAALEVNCAVLYSEDMQDGQLIGGTLTIKNPFKGK